MAHKWAPTAMLQRRSKPADDMPFRFAIATIAGCMLVGQAHADTPLQNQMQRVIELEQVDKWCTGAHEIDCEFRRNPARDSDLMSATVPI